MENRRILICAHSGGEHTIENTIESMKVLEGFPIDAMEVDLNLMEDGRVCLGHDRGTVRCDFMEFADFIRGKNYLVNLDVKDIGAVENAMEILKDEPAERFYFSGLGLKSGLIEYSRMQGEFRCLAGLDPEDVDISRLHFRDYCQTLVEEARSLGAFGINLHYRLLTSTLLSTARDMGMEVHVWTVDREEDMRRLKDMGVDSITSNNLKALTGILQEEIMLNPN